MTCVEKKLTQLQYKSFGINECFMRIQQQFRIIY